jgi:hypothetical protein
VIVWHNMLNLVARQATFIVSMFKFGYGVLLCSLCRIVVTSMHLLLGDEKSVYHK